MHKYLEISNVFVQFCSTQGQFNTRNQEILPAHPKGTAAEYCSWIATGIKLAGLELATV